MKNVRIKYTAPWLLLPMALILIGGCAATTDSNPEPDAVIEQAAEIEPWDGDGMEIPLDGSSMEAWQRSMERVKAHSRPETYSSLESAIKYLLTYDLAARGDKEKLIGQLDGMTGYEVISRVRWQKPLPGRGKPEKNATDASLIDT